MKVRILSSAPGPWSERHYLMSFVVDEALAIDAGSLGLHPSANGAGPLDVFLTHAHLDHVATLPLYLEEQHARDAVVRVHGPRATLRALAEHLFNEEVWIGEDARRSESRSWFELCPLEPERCVESGPYRITPVPVHHTVSAFGYIVERDGAAAVFAGDSGATDRLWALVAVRRDVRAVFLECSFPSDQEALARRTGHLTPALWPRELEKLPASARVIAVHLKPSFHERIVSELDRLGDPRISIGRPGREYVL